MCIRDRVPTFDEILEVCQGKIGIYLDMKDADLEQTLRKVQQLAAESSLDVLRFKPEAMRPQQYYAEFPITLDLDGSFHNLAYFFDRLSRLSRIVNVTNLSVEAKREPSLSSTISASCTATTFVFIEQAPAPADAPGAPGAPAGAR